MQTEQERESWQQRVREGTVSKEWQYTVSSIWSGPWRRGLHFQTSLTAPSSLMWEETTLSRLSFSGRVWVKPSFEVSWIKIPPLSILHHMFLGTSDLSGSCFSFHLQACFVMVIFLLATFLFSFQNMSWGLFIILLALVASFCDEDQLQGLSARQACQWKLNSTLWDF